MTLEVYQKIHENDSLEKLLDCIRDEVYWISCDARSAGWYDAEHSEENKRYCSAEVEHHKKRVAWICDTIAKKI